jgi:hypothetical protein
MIRSEKLGSSSGPGGHSKTCDCLVALKVCADSFQNGPIALGHVNHRDNGASTTTVSIVDSAESPPSRPGSEWSAEHSLRESRPTWKQKPKAPLSAIGPLEQKI